ncbi:ATP-binding protein [Nocardioides sp. GCM10027113]|uniref:sensor histidine kinase n=1 Tax=unclassified Nocardioides TaxID=2615069 RepID=UPI00361150D2
MSVPEWSLRGKLALALTIPMLLAAVLGGLRVMSESAQATNHASTAGQVTVLPAAVAYLAAAEHAAVVGRTTGLDDPERLSAVRRVDAAATELERAGAAAPLTTRQRARLDSLLELSDQLRDGRAYVSVGQSVSQVRQLHRGVSQLLASIVDAQIEPEPRLRTLAHVLDGRLSLAMQQVMVAEAGDRRSVSAELAAEVGVEAAAIERLGVDLGTVDPTVLGLRQQNALHFATARDGGTDLGGAAAYTGYDELTTELLQGVDRELAAATDRSRTLAALTAATTLGALLAAVLLALLVARLLLRPIHRVRDGAREVAEVRLPEAIRRIREGQDPGQVVPLDVTTREEVGQLARAVDDLHRRAVSLAAGEAEARARVGEMFVTLSRRSTSLVNQQLALIENLERDEEDPERLEALFRLDHLASRMRRTGDSLLVLADAPPRPGGIGSLAVVDALQAACAGVQDYQRVQVLGAPEDTINAAAAADVVHLLTELVDNALAYSPPTAAVTVMPSREGSSILVQVVDAGLGIPPADLTSINAELESGGQVTPDTARRMGLLVVGRLARRHGITVRLERNERNGTTAKVVLPARVLANGGRDATVQGPTVERPAHQPAQQPEPAGPAPRADEPSVAQISAAIDAVLGLSRRSPGQAAPTAPPAPSLAPVAGAAPPDPADPADPADPSPAAPDLPVRVPAAAVTSPAALTVVPPVVEEPVAEEPVVEEPIVEEPVALAPLPVRRDALDPSTRVPDSPGDLDDLDDSPIFRELRSGWLTPGGTSAAGWTSPEIDAGWEAADRTSEAPAAPLTDAGLPMRRPGGRLVPGGVGPGRAPAATVPGRDPEAIRARLSAHSAGVARGRLAASGTPAPDSPRQEAGTP